MPYTAKQKRLFGAELGRMKRGMKPMTGMTHAQLVEGIHSPTKPAVKRGRKKYQYGRGGKIPKSALR